MVFLMLALTHTQPQTVGETGLLIIYIYINNVFFSFFRILFFFNFCARTKRVR